MGCNRRRITVGSGIAGGFVAAVVGMGIAQADSPDVNDLDLLTAASTNADQAFDIVANTSGTPASDTPQLGSAITELADIEKPLLTSDNDVFSGLGHLLFDGPDQEISQTSETFLAAAQAYQLDPSPDNLLTTGLTSFQFDGAVLESIPAEVIGKLVDQILDIGDFDTVPGSVTDVAADAGGAGADLASLLDLPF